MEAVQVRPPVPPDGAVEAQQTTSDFVECYLMHYRRLVRALRLGGADPATAEDLAQEAFARALARWRRVRKGANPPGYVYRTGFRLLQRALRRSGRETTTVRRSPRQGRTPPPRSRSTSRPLWPGCRRGGGPAR